MSGNPSEGMVIVGGGPAGAAAACRLAAAGRPVTLLEKARGPHHKVCGEFLSGEACDDLAALGIDLRALGCMPIRRVRLLAGRQGAESPLPFAAFGVSRYRLDEAMLKKAEALGVAVRRGVTVHSIARPDSGPWRLATSQGAWQADTIFLATGKHDLRPFHRGAAARDGMIGFKMYLRLTAAQTGRLRETIELILFDGGYAGLQLVEADTANLCLLVRKSAFARAGKSWPALLDRLAAACPPLGERLAGAAPCWAAPVAVAALPFGYLADETAVQPGLYPIGDQACVIPALSGDGIAIAIHTARLAAECHLAGGDAAAYLRRARAELHRPLALADGLARWTERGWSRGLALAACRLFPPLLVTLAHRSRIAVPHARTVIRL